MRLPAYLTNSPPGADTSSRPKAKQSIVTSTTAAAWIPDLVGSAQSCTVVLTDVGVAAVLALGKFRNRTEGSNGGLSILHLPGSAVLIALFL